MLTSTSCILNAFLTVTPAFTVNVICAFFSIRIDFNSIVFMFAVFFIFVQAATTSTVSLKPQLNAITASSVSKLQIPANAMG